MADCHMIAERRRVTDFQKIDFFLAAFSSFFVVIPISLMMIIRSPSLPPRIEIRNVGPLRAKAMRLYFDLLVSIADGDVNRSNGRICICVFGNGEHDT